MLNVRLITCIGLVSLSLMSVSGWGSGRHRVTSPSPTATATPAPSSSPTPSPTLSPSPAPLGKGFVTFDPVDGYATDAEMEKIASAGKKLNQVIQSSCFHDFMSKRALIQTNGRTPVQVADHLQSLAGVVPVVMYYRCMRSWKCPTGTSAVAYRQPPSITINLNRAVYTNAKSDCDWASVEGHESLGHSLGGYEHDFDWSPSREFSVPYSINHAFEACCR